MLASQFYEKEITCPICLTKFNVIIVKANKCIPIGKDEDFRQIYQDVTPFFYDIWSCPSCHYSAPKNIFHTVKPAETVAIAEVLAKSKLKINPLGERESEDALICYKLALLCMSYRKIPASSIAGILQKTAWIYRLQKNEALEQEYMNKAIKYYEEAYSTERFPIGGMSEIRLGYIIGELHRRTKHYPEAIQYFSKLVHHPLANSEPAILKMARDQWAKAKEEYNLVKNGGEDDAAAVEEE